MLTIILSYIMFFLLLAFLGYATRLRKFLLGSFRDATLVSLLGLCLFRLCWVLSGQLNPAEIEEIIHECIKFVHLHQVSMLLVGAGMILLMLWRWSVGKSPVAQK